MKNKILRPIIIILFLMFSGVCLVQCSNSKEETYKIASILPQTGVMASFGEQMRQGQALAEELINQQVFWKQDKKLEIVFLDGKSEAKSSIAAYQKARMEGINFFTTTLSSVALSLIPLIKRDKTFLLANAAHPSISRSGDTIFRHSCTADREARLIYEKLQQIALQKIAVIVVNDDYGKAFQDTLQKLLKISNSEIASKITYEKGETNFRSIVVKLLDKQPDGVVMCGVGAAAGLIVKTIREYQYKGEILATNTFAYPAAQKAAGAAAKGVRYIAVDFDYNDSLYTEINKRYQNKYQEDIGTLALIEFNTILFLAHAINHSENKNVVDVARYIRQLGVYQGAGERMSILQTGDIIPQLKIVAQ